MKQIGLLLCAVIALFSGALFAGEGEAFLWRWSLEKGNAFSVTCSMKDHASLTPEETSLSVLSGPGKHRLTPVSVPVKSNQNLFEKKAEWTFLLPEENAFPLTISLAWQGCIHGKDGEMMCLLPVSLSRTILSPEHRSGTFQVEQSVKTEVELPPYDLIRQADGYLNESAFLAFLNGSAETKPFSWAGKGFLTVLILTLLGGIALNLTPCVLPMIPVTLAVIGARSGSEKCRESFLRGSVYALGMASACGIAGFVVILGGGVIGELASGWLFNVLAGILFLLLGLAMTDLFFLDLSRWRNRWKPRSAAALSGVFLLGALSSLLAGACVAPVVLAVMLYASGLYASGNPGGLLLPFVLGIGMGLPWPAAAAGLTALPKPGRWMKWVKRLFALLIIGIGIYYLVLGWTLFSRRTPVSAGLLPDLEKRLQSCAENGTPVLLEFRADWCKNCVLMEKTVLPSPDVQKALQNFCVISVDATDPEDPRIRRVLAHFQVNGMPAFRIIRVR